MKVLISYHAHPSVDAVTMATFPSSFLSPVDMVLAVNRACAARPSDNRDEEEEEEEDVLAAAGSIMEASLAAAPASPFSLPIYCRC